MKKIADDYTCIALLLDITTIQNHKDIAVLIIKNINDTGLTKKKMICKSRRKLFYTNSC